MNARTDYIHEFHNGRIPKSWSELLAEKLNIDYEIYGAINCDFKFIEKFGNSNTSIFFNFTRLVKEIKEDDNGFVVIHVVKEGDHTHSDIKTQIRGTP
jgi:hypothetical protein